MIPARNKTTSRTFGCRAPVAVLAVAAAWFGSCVGLADADEPTTGEATPSVQAKDGTEAASSTRGTPPFETRIRPLLTKYCAECHGEKKTEADVAFTRYESEAAAQSDRATWERVLAMLEAGAMPPADHKPRPSEAETAEILKWIDATFLHVDCGLVHDPGRVTIRRLNRAEYNNTIRDLVGVDFRPAQNFPSDDVGNGFDSIGDVLSVSPLLFEKYMEAAEQIVGKAIVVDMGKPLVIALAANKLEGVGEASRGNAEFVVLNTARPVFADVQIAAADEFVVRIEAAASPAGTEPAKLEFRVDGRPIHEFEIKGKLDVYETRVKLEEGKRRVEAALLNEFQEPATADSEARERSIYLRSIELAATTPPKPSELPEAHRRIVTCVPGDGRSVQDCARAILLPFASRAYRRPAGEEDIAGIVRLVDSIVAQGDSFERGIQIGVQAVLVSPHFLFRVENDPEPDNPGRAHSINQYELASRLSYFLWSSMPDEELFALAETGVLDQPDVIEKQVRRMLADGKSRALIDNFASQWLNLRSIDDARPSKDHFPTFDRRLQAEMLRETDLFVEYVMREDRDILEFLNADYTFINSRLAKHYGIEGVNGGTFRKVSLEGTHRAGILTQGSILLLTSEPTRTSPVRRGKWILDNILGTPPPPPPANVPELAQTKKTPGEPSVRQRLEVHRSDPACASCHAKLDPLGLAFENFDGVGSWRDTEGDKPVDASGILPSGETFNGAEELIKLLSARETDFARHLTKTMLTYALGRGLEYYDSCTVDEVVRRLGANGNRFSTLVVEICKSDPFLKRRGEAEPNE